MNLTKFQQQLQTKYIGKHCLFFDEVDSSNDEAFRQYEKTPVSGLVVMARQQTKARGRLGRKWHTEPDKALAISVILRPTVALEQWSQLTLVAGLALQKTLCVYAPQAKIKWPNDILVNGKKLAGILSESKMRSDSAALVIGIGINLAEPNQGWPSEITQAVTDLESNSVKKANAQQLTIELLQQLDQCYDAYLKHGFSAIQQPWWAAHYASNQKIRAHHQGHYIEGVATGLDHDGCLLLQAKDKLHRILSGEIQLL